MNFQWRNRSVGGVLIATLYCNQWQVRRGDSSFLKYESNNEKNITLTQIYEKCQKHEKIGESREIGENSRLATWTWTQLKTVQFQTLMPSLYILLMNERTEQDKKNIN